MEFETLVDGVNFGEGPRWHEGHLWYSDFYQHTVYRVTAGGDRTAMVVLEDERPSGLGWMPDGDLLIVAMKSRQVLRWDGSSLIQHADLSNLATGYCNDMVLRSDGTAYVGNFGFDLESRADFAPAALIQISPDGAATIAADGLAFPNGTVLTPDEKTLIVGESFGGSYQAFDVAPDGSLSNKREWAAIAGTAPDGCCLDADGAIWFADATGSQLIRVAEGGEVLATVPTPMPVYACMLGGDDGRTLYALMAPGAHPDEVGDKAGGMIASIRVDSPHAGRP